MKCPKNKLIQLGMIFIKQMKCLSKSSKQVHEYIEYLHQKIAKNCLNITSVDWDEI